MKTLILIAFILLLAGSPVSAQTYTEIGADRLEELTRMENDTTYVINFWATWCAPCVREIGYFEELHREKFGEKVRVILVSLDFPDRAEKRVIPFLADKDITARVLLMTDMDYNKWIDRVDPSWSGAIPATLIYNRSGRIFLEQELSRDELFTHVNQKIK